MSKKHPPASSMHRIGLPAPWEVTALEPPDRWLCQRNFNRPTGLGAEHHLALEVTLLDSSIELVHCALNDQPLTIGLGQSIEQRQVGHSFKCDCPLDSLAERNRVSLQLATALEPAVLLQRLRVALLISTNAG